MDFVERLKPHDGHREKSFLVRIASLVIGVSATFAAALAQHRRKLCDAAHAISGVSLESLLECMLLTLKPLQQFLHDRWDAHWHGGGLTGPIFTGRKLVGRGHDEVSSHLLACCRHQFTSRAYS